MRDTDQPERLDHAIGTAPSEKPTYALPLQQWNEMVALANHLATREAEMPLRRRMAAYLTEETGCSEQHPIHDRSARD